MKGERDHSDLAIEILSRIGWLSDMEVKQTRICALRDISKTGELQVELLFESGQVKGIVNLMSSSFKGLQGVAIQIIEEISNYNNNQFIQQLLGYQILDEISELLLQ
jgi:hypothetical protein